MARIVSERINLNEKIIRELERHLSNGHYNGSLRRVITYNRWLDRIFKPYNILARIRYAINNDCKYVFIKKDNLDILTSDKNLDNVVRFIENKLR